MADPEIIADLYVGHDGFSEGRTNRTKGLVTLCCKFARRRTEEELSPPLVVVSQTCEADNNRLTAR